MANLLQTGSAWLGEQMASHAATDVLYRRGALSVTVPAVIGETAAEDVDLDEQVRRSRERDFLVRVADLLLGGEAVTPLPGDRIEHEVNGVTHTFIVGPQPGGEQAWRYATPHHHQYRIHTALESDPQAAPEVAGIDGTPTP